MGEKGEKKWFGKFMREMEGCGFCVRFQNHFFYAVALPRREQPHGPTPTDTDVADAAVAAGKRTKRDVFWAELGLGVPRGGEYYDCEGS